VKGEYGSVFTNVVWHLLADRVIALVTCPPHSANLQNSQPVTLRFLPPPPVSWPSPLLSRRWNTDKEKASDDFLACYHSNKKIRSTPMVSSVWAV
jgi:hypothetical protein